MIEIVFGHVIDGEILHQKKISIGNGLPIHGQISLISLITEDIELGSGNVVWATMHWHFCDWIFKLRKKLKSKGV